MSQREYRIGPGAASLMLLVVVLSMCVLGVLALMGSRSDEGLSLRSIQVAQEVARLNVQAERWLADLDEKLKAASETAADEAEYLEAVGASLEDGMALDGHRISWQESDENGRMLSCGVELAPRGGNPRYRRLEHRLITEEEAIDDADWLGGNGALPTWN